MGKNFNIAIVDDELATTHCIKYKLLERQQVDNVDMIESGKELMRKMKHRKYDVVFLDYLMPGMDGIDVLQFIRENYPRVKVIFHTEIHDNEILKVILNARAHGLLYKQFKCPDAWRSVETVLDDRHFLSDEYIRMIQEDNSFAASLSADDGTEKPSDREMEILLLHIAGLMAKTIGDKLCISEHTVSSHLKSAYGKINEHNTYGCIRYCLMHNIFTVSFFTNDREKEKVITQYQLSPLTKKGDKKLPKNK